MTDDLQLKPSEDDDGDDLFRLLAVVADRGIAAERATNAEKIASNERMYTAGLNAEQASEGRAHQIALVQYGIVGVLILALLGLVAWLVVHGQMREAMEVVGFVVSLGTGYLAGRSSTNGDVRD